jgi:hypothetical protein
MKEVLATLDAATPGIVPFILYGTCLREFDTVRAEPALQAWLAKVGLTEANARVQAWRAAHPAEKLK